CVYECHAGLVDFSAPIIVDGMVLGTVIGGQVRTTDVDEDFVRRKAEEYDIAPEEYIKAAKETSCLDKETIEKAAHFLEELAAGLSNMAYRNYKTIQECLRMENAAKSQADFVMNMALDLETSLNNWFSIIEDKKNAADSEETKTLLTNMENDSAEMRSNIRDTIEYIRMSASKLELYEKEYHLEKLAKSLEEDFVQYNREKQFQIDVVVKDCVDKNLFGDDGRISQMLNRIVKTVLEKKTKGKLVVELSTKQISYATMLDIHIIDCDTDYNEHDVLKFNELFSKNHEEDIEDNDLDEMIISYIGMILKKMAGTISFACQDKDFVVSVCMPQLAM
ncbi:MAG: PocR ligand-binding domain-containing protein, partial [Lachnospiraceae bacterium]